MQLSENIKRQLLVGLIVLSILPLVGIIAQPSFETVKSTTLVMSAYAGYIGMVILLWSYVLGAKSIAGIFFKDIAPILRIHKWLGKYGSLAIFAHPLLVSYSYGVTWLYSFIPDISSRFESHVTLGRFAFIIILFVWISSAILRSKIKFRPWRYIHLFSYIALPYVFLHVPDVGSQFMSSVSVKMYFYSLLVVYFAVTALRIRGLLNIDKKIYEISLHKQLVSDSPSIWYVKLKPPNFNSKVVPEKGQYVYIKDGRISEEHPFSILDYDPKTGEIGIAYRTFGRFTKEFSKRTIGQKVLISKPFGQFTSELSTNKSPVVFIAGGVGITPMFRQIAENNGQEKWLFFSNRTKKSAMILPQLRSILGLNFVSTYTRENRVEAPDIMGRIDRNTICNYLENPRQYQYYICGSDKMMKDITKVLRELGVAKKAIHIEAFSW